MCGGATAPPRVSAALLVELPPRKEWRELLAAEAGAEELYGAALEAAAGW